MSDYALCENGHELWVVRGSKGENVSVKEARARSVYIDANFCPKCGAEIAEECTVHACRMQ